MNLGESFSSDTCERFQRLVDLLISSPHNLTSVRDRERAMVAHIEDSLLAFEGYKLEGSYIDIGSGGGDSRTGSRDSLSRNQVGTCRFNREKSEGN